MCVSSFSAVCMCVRKIIKWCVCVCKCAIMYTCHRLLTYKAGIDGSPKKKENFGMHGYIHM